MMLHTDILCWDTLSEVLQLHISGFSFSTLLSISYREEIQARSNETKTLNWIDKQFHDWQERIWNKLGIRTIYKQGDWIKIKAYKYTINIQYDGTCDPEIISFDIIQIKKIMCSIINQFAFIYHVCIKAYLVAVWSIHVCTY